MPSALKSFVLLTGLSGAGKSTAMAVLEDLGFFCIDNLPVSILESFLKMESLSKTPHSRLAIHMDARDFDFLKKHSKILSALKKKIPVLKVVFLTASEETLIRRFSETRRRHPLARGADLRRALKKERDKSEALKNSADVRIDTSHLSVHALRAAIENIFSSKKRSSKLPLSLVSFGYRYGLPAQCDLVLDVRFLPNPFFVPALKPLDGSRPNVRNFVLKRPETRRFLAKIQDLLKFLIPHYEREGKQHLTIGFGCTGGRHRSVALAHYFKGYFEKKGHWVHLEHRDVHKK